MWIRIQNGKRLVEVKDIVLTAYNDPPVQKKKKAEELKTEVYQLLALRTDDENILLGSFSSEEKAFKVLEQIQNRIDSMISRVFVIPPDID